MFLCRTDSAWFTKQPIISAGIHNGGCETHEVHRCVVTFCGFLFCPISLFYYAKYRYTYRISYLSEGTDNPDFFSPLSQKKENYREYRPYFIFQKLLQLWEETLKENHVHTKAHTPQSRVHLLSNCGRNTSRPNQPPESAQQSGREEARRGGGGKEEGRRKNDLDKATKENEVNGFRKQIVKHAGVSVT